MGFSAKQNSPIIMRKKTIIISSIALAFAFTQVKPDTILHPVKHFSDVLSLGKAAIAQTPLSPLAKQPDAGTLLASHGMSMDNRYPVQSVADIFRDNILLPLHYMSGQVTQPSQINWDEIRKPYKYEFVLKPGEVFAYHDDVLPEYQGNVAMTTKAHFNAQEGFLSDGFLYGDGVCHFASLMNWVGQDAGLKVDARVNHDFANIPEISREYGTSIITNPSGSSLNEQMQNLYITNTSDKPVRFVFEYDGEEMKMSIYKMSNIKCRKTIPYSLNLFR